MPTTSSRTRAGKAATVAPAPSETAAVFHALGDPNRLAIVRQLLADAEKACGSFDVDVTASTLSHHFKVLREARVIEQRADGYRKLNTIHPFLRAHFPGLLADLAGVDG